jgi:hypothetical protein
MVGTAEAMHGQFFQHLSHTLIRDVHARGDEPQEDSLLEKLGRNPLTSLEAGGGTPLVSALPQAIAARCHEVSCLFRERRRCRDRMNSR